jgi:plasmid rolling circle replication initiator protein Rep
MPHPNSTQLAGSIPLAEISPSDRPWDEHGASRDDVAALYRELDHPYAVRMETCAQLLEFALKFDDQSDALKTRLQSARFCRVRHCPVCQWRRSLRHRALFFRALPSLQADYPSHRFLFLTLTVRNCPLEGLRQQIDHLSKSWHSFTKRNFPADGWVRSLEVTRGKDGTAHPHYHCLLMVPKAYFFEGSYLSQAAWTDKWRSALRIDYTPVVNIKAVKPNSEDRGGLPGAVCETLKYSVKPADLVADRDWLLGITQQMHNVRSFATGGIIKTYLAALEQEETNDDLVNVGDPLDTVGELARFLSYWNRSIRHYCITE